MPGLNGGGWFPRTTKKRISPNVRDYNDNLEKKTNLFEVVNAMSLVKMTTG